MRHEYHRNRRHYHSCQNAVAILAGQVTDDVYAANLREDAATSRGAGGRATRPGVGLRHLQSNGQACPPELGRSRADQRAQYQSRRVSGYGALRCGHCRRDAGRQVAIGPARRAIAPGCLGMIARLVPKRHWRSYDTDPLPTGREALDEPVRAFPSWFLRITCDRCGKDRMLSMTHTPRRDMPIRDITSPACATTAAGGTADRHRGSRSC